MNILTVIGGSTDALQGYPLFSMDIRDSNNDSTNDSIVPRMSLLVSTRTKHGLAVL